MSSEYWKRFWNEHGRETVDAPPQTQVLRTLNKQPIDAATFERIVAQIESSIALGPGDDLVDLCCGNGAITVRLAARCRTALGVDVSPHLLEQIDSASAPNLSLVVADVASVELEPDSFSRALIYAGIQYFSEEQIVRLVLALHRALRPGGLLLLGDVPDARRIWAFFNSPDRERAYFESIVAGKPIIGTWLDPEWLLRLGRFAGFAECELLPQPADLPYAHYRYDLVMRKA